MTNREAYNSFIRELVEKQLAFMEGMSNEEFVDYTVKYPNYHIEVKLGNMLCLFKCNSGKMPVGGPGTVTTWLNSERTEEEKKAWEASEEWNREREERLNDRKRTQSETAPTNP